MAKMMRLHDSDRKRLRRALLSGEGVFIFAVRLLEAIGNTNRGRKRKMEK